MSPCTRASTVQGTPGTRASTVQGMPGTRAKRTGMGGGRCGVLGCGKGTSVGLDRAIEYRRIIDSFRVLNVPTDVQALIHEALVSNKWDWFADCDGCTGVSELYWPTIYFPPCLRHDFDWATGNGGWQANAMFFRIQRAYGMGSVHAGVRFLGVTVSWYIWFKWRG